MEKVFTARYLPLVNARLLGPIDYELGRSGVGHNLGENMMKKFIALALASAALVSTAANANVIQVTPSNMQGWEDVVSESSNGGHAEITGLAYDGNGSVAAHGDRNRFVLGGLAGLYGNPNTPGATNNLGALSSFTDLGFSYSVDLTSAPTAANALYGPALRIVFYQGAVKDELVFEQAYQAGAYGAAAAKGDWNVTNSASTFYLKSLGNENTQMTMSDWISSRGFGDAKVGGIYVGVGSGVGKDVFVHYDNIVAGGNTYKFDLSASGGAVPEPASWAMMLGGIGLVGGAMRRRRRNTSVTFA